MSVTVARRIVGLVGVITAVTSCATTLGSVRFDQPGRNEILLDLEPDSTLRFYSDLDLRFDKDEAHATRMYFLVELEQHGEIVARTTCFPLGGERGLKRCDARMLRPDRIRLNCLMQGCELRVANGGPTLVRASLVISRQPSSMSIQRADLIVKQ